MSSDSGSDFIFSEDQSDFDSDFESDEVSEEENISPRIRFRKKDNIPSTKRTSNRQSTKRKHSTKKDHSISSYKPSWTKRARKDTKISENNKQLKLRDYLTSVHQKGNKTERKGVFNKWRYNGKRSYNVTDDYFSSDNLSSFIVDSDESITSSDYDEKNDDDDNNNNVIETVLETSFESSIGSPVKKRKPACKYGSQCYRRNPLHRERYSHPSTPVAFPSSESSPWRSKTRRGRLNDSTEFISLSLVESEEEVVTFDTEDEEEDEEEEEEEEVEVEDEDDVPSAQSTEEETDEESESEEEEDKNTYLERKIKKILDRCYEHSSMLRDQFKVMKTTLKEQKQNRSPSLKREKKKKKNNNNNTLKKCKNDITVVNQPAMLGEKQLRPFQLVGLNWLCLLYRVKQNGILADEMGLGKTVQTASLFASLSEQGVKGRYLVVVPASTLMNWQRELSEWAPKLNVLVYYGKDRDLLRSKVRRKPEKYHIWLTTYDYTFRKPDRKFLHSFLFTYLVLDEAQNIKNVDSLRHRRLFSIKSERRLLLTGTPLQNNLEELFALLYFLIPKLFDSLDQFKDMRTKLTRLCKGKSIEENPILDRIKECLAPYILRRLKSEVAMNLPPKREKIVMCPMTPMQKKVMERLIRHSRNVWEKDEDIVHSKKSLNNILMQLRKLANHPLLARSLYTDTKVTKFAKILHKNDKNYKEENLKFLIEDLMLHSDFELSQIADSTDLLVKFRLTEKDLFDTCGKLLVLRKLLKRIHSDGSRLIIFSQMTRVLDILEPFLESQGHRFLRLDGSTPIETRLELIDQFTNDKEIFAFLLSTTAGGVGINLTACNVVVFFDISFNPQVDIQATDRVHRLGQNKDVTIYKLITPDSIEEHIHEMAEQKKALSNAILEEGKFKKGKIERDQTYNILRAVVSKELHVPSDS